MVQTMQRQTELRSAPRVRQGDDQATFLSRWLKVWVILLTVVTLVVVVYLIIITSTLASINSNLRTADRAVTGAGGNVQTLPAQVDRINGALAAIDPALKPIPGQANDIIAALTSINDKLTNTDASLKDTSSVLVTVLGQVNSVRDLLIDADDPPDRLGVQNIHRRVASINGQGSPSIGVAPGGGGCGEFCQGENLTTAEADAANILAGLISVNGHLDSICNSPGATLVAGGNC
jgi:cell division protein FtsL